MEPKFQPPEFIYVEGHPTPYGCMPRYVFGVNGSLSLTWSDGGHEQAIDIDRVVKDDEHELRFKSGPHEYVARALTLKDWRGLRANGWSYLPEVESFSELRFNFQKGFS